VHFRHCNQLQKWDWNLHVKRGLRWPGAIRPVLTLQLPFSLGFSLRDTFAIDCKTNRAQQEGVTTKSQMMPTQQYFSSLSLSLSHVCFFASAINCRAMWAAQVFNSPCVAAQIGKRECSCCGRALQLIAVKSPYPDAPGDTDTFTRYQPFPACFVGSHLCAGSIPA